MGILNVTPDSFSDGGRFLRAERAVQHGLKMVEEGADCIDIGGESTRPFSDPIPLDEELHRVIPVIQDLAGRVSIPISVDTYKSRVAEAALDAGAAMVNDISALRFDPRMAGMLAERDVPVVLMHMLGSPRDMQKDPRYGDVIEDIRRFFEGRMETALRSGIREEQIILDPGIGFGKTVNHNLEILRRLGEFLSLGRPILIGSSRKFFIGKVLNKPPDLRETGTNATVAVAVSNGSRIVRVHDVSSAKDTVRMVEAIKNGLVETCGNS